MQQNRTTQRKLVGLLVKLAHKGLDEFASKYATNLSDGGMFIRTREPKPVGTELSFKVEIADGQRVLQGTAVVRWTRPDNDAGGPPGMGLEFLTLDPASRALVDRMMGHAADVAPPSIPAVAPSLPDDDEPFTMTAPVQAGVPAAPPVAPMVAPRVAPLSTAPRASSQPGAVASPTSASPTQGASRAAQPGVASSPVTPQVAPVTSASPTQAAGASRAAQHAVGSPAPASASHAASSPTQGAGAPRAAQPAVASSPVTTQVAPVTSASPTQAAGASRAAQHAVGSPAPASASHAASTQGAGAQPAVASSPVTPQVAPVTASHSASPTQRAAQPGVASSPVTPQVAPVTTTSHSASPTQGADAARASQPAFGSSPVTTAPRSASPTQGGDQPTFGSVAPQVAAAPASAPLTQGAGAPRAAPAVVSSPATHQAGSSPVAPAGPSQPAFASPVTAPPAGGPRAASQSSPFTSVPTGATSRPAVAPVAVTGAGSAQTVTSPGVAPEPAASEFEIPIEDGDLFTGSAEVDLSRAVEVDFDSLLGSTPAADAPFSSSDSGVAIDLEPLEQIDPLPATPLGDAELPTIRRAPVPAAPVAPAAPVVLDSRPATPAPAAAPQAGPVYLKDVKAGDATGPVIGIDLGTTNSACAVLTRGRPIILSSKDGYNTIPSVVALTAQNRLLIGHRAKSQLVLNPTQSIFGAKRLVGREFDSPTVKQVKERSHFDIVPGADRRAAVRLGDKVLSLEEVQALVLKECREMAEQALGTPVSRAVITCPAYYSEPQREAVRRAGAMAGLKVERVLNEPTAAALAFGMNREFKKTVLVYDLGGGTFDATLLKVDQNVFEVLATGGDVFLGGTDFDNQIVDLLLRRFQDWHKRPFSGDRVALSRIAEVAEKAKIALSEQKSFDVHLPMLEMDGNGKPLDLRTTVSRADLEDACHDLIDRTLQAVHDVLLDAKLKASQVDDIILVGGMSRMPLVREKLKELFKKPAHASVNADEAVALGAALYSGTVDKVSSLVLIDVVPMTIGLGRPGGSFHRLIERNTPLPATRSFGLSTQKDDETELEVMVFQGEDSNVAGNEFLGAVTISGLPKGPKGSVQVAVTLGLDAECVLRVEAREFKTRQVVRATLATRYTTEEIAQRLGITAEKREAVNKSRTEELEKRAGGFWSKLKGLFKR